MTERVKYVYIPKDWELAVRLWILESLKSLDYTTLDSSSVRVRYANLNIYVPKESYVTIRPTETEDYTFTERLNVRDGKLFEDTVTYKKSLIRLKSYGPFSHIIMTHLASCVSDSELNHFNKTNKISIPSTEDKLINIHEDDREEIIYVWTQEYNVDHCFLRSREIPMVENISSCPHFQSIPIPPAAVSSLLTDGDFVLVDGEFILIDSTT